MQYYSIQIFATAKHLQGHKGLTTSETLTKLWGKGGERQQTIGDVTFQSAAYVAGYVQKKINGQQKDTHYAIVDQQYWRILWSTTTRVLNHEPAPRHSWELVRQT